MKAVYEDIAEGSQDVVYAGVFDVKGQKVRIDIRRDSYANQSYAIAKVFSKTLNSWEFLESIHYSRMRSKRELRGGSWYIANYQGDVDELLHKAGQILEG